MPVLLVRSGLQLSSVLERGERFWFSNWMLSYGGVCSRWMAFLSSLAFSFLLSSYFALRIGCNQVQPGCESKKPINDQMIMGVVLPFERLLCVHFRVNQLLLNSWSSSVCVSA